MIASVSINILVKFKLAEKEHSTIIALRGAESAVFAITKYSCCLSGAIFILKHYTRVCFAVAVGKQYGDNDFLIRQLRRDLIRSRPSCVGLPKFYSNMVVAYVV